RHDTPFEWGPAQQTAFQTLKNALTQAPILILPDFTKPFKVFIDACGKAIGEVLTQDHGNGDQPIAYRSRQLSRAEQNYPVHDQEFLAFVDCIKAWRHYLGIRHFDVYTDHWSLQHRETQQHLTGRQGRWAEKVGAFDFTIKYKPGKQNTVADALSRSSQMDV